MLKTAYILILFAFLFTTGCKVIGDYSLSSGFSNVHLTLKEDSTFIYRSFFDAGGTDTIAGRWTKHKKIVTLNSYAKPEFKPNTVYEKPEPNKNEKLIIIQFMDESASHTIISINNDQEIDTLKPLNDTTYLGDPYPMDLTSAYTHLNPINNIRILKTDNSTDCILKDSLFKISNPSSNLIIIYAQPYNHYSGMKYFVNTEWKIHYNRIYTWRKSNMKFDKEVFLSKRKNNICRSGILP